MMSKILGILTVTTAAFSSIAFATPAEAQNRYYQNDGYYQQVRNDGYREYRRGDYYRGQRSERRYNDRRAYGDQRRYNNRRYYSDRRYRCDRGTGGTIIGAIAGGLLGNEVARRGNKTEGAIIGGAVGALAGRAIDRNC